MDARNPYNQYSGYLGLLNNVQEHLVQENFPTESFPSSVNLGDSVNSAVCSQQSEALPVPDGTPKERVARSTWTTIDDGVLISAWLNTSKDVVVSNNQKGGTFWKRVGEYFGEALNENGENVACKQRWQRINDQVNKFFGAYAAAERQLASGQNANDVLKMAHDIFNSDHSSKFNLDHAWCMLRFEQKWLNLNTSKTGSSKRKTGEGGTGSPSTHLGEEEIRPEGVKAAKAQRKNSQDKALEAYKSMYDMKNADMDQKEKLSKYAIVDTLLARTTPLTESEEIVKNKLLSELF